MSEDHDAHTGFGAFWASNLGWRAGVWNYLLISLLWIAHVRYDYSTMKEIATIDEKSNASKPSRESVAE